MEISIIIIDDDSLNSSSLIDTIESYDSNFTKEGVIYKVKEVFTKIHAFTEARSYIISSQDGIDVMLADYNLLQGYGTDLFKLIRKENEIYKILHSETDDSLMKSKESFISHIYNDFCRSKNRETVHEALRKYETEILDIKIYGNKALRKTYFINEKRLNLKAEKYILKNIRYFDVLYAETDGKSKEWMTVYFRDMNSNKINQIKKSKLTINEFRQSDLVFKRVNPSMIVNLLWVADINTINKTIRFITKNNSVFEISFEPTEGCFDKEIDPALSYFDSIPSFLKT